MSTPGVDRGGRPRIHGREDDPLVSVSLHVRKSQLTELDQLAVQRTLAGPRWCARPSIGCSTPETPAHTPETPVRVAHGSTSSTRTYASRLRVAGPTLQRRVP